MSRLPERLWPSDHLCGMSQHAYAIKAKFQGWDYYGDWVMGEWNNGTRIVPTRYNCVTNVYQADWITDTMFGSFWPGARGGVTVMHDSGDVMFVPVAVTGDGVHLFRSVDFGVTWSLAMKFGDIGASRIADVYMLSRNNLCEYVWNGSTYYLLLEHNANASRVDGSTNDQVRLMRSADRGASWSAIATWNTSGHQVLTGKCVQKDPTGNRIYLSFGDSDSESGLVEWDLDATSNAWTAGDNKTFAQIDATTGYACVYGDQRASTTQILWHRRNGRYTGYLYFSSHSLASNHGIYRAIAGLPTVHKCMQQAAFVADHIGCGGAQSDNGTLYFGSTRYYASGAPADDNVGAYCAVHASKDGIYFHEIGRMANDKTVDDARYNLPWVKAGKIYWPQKATARKGAGTCVFECRDTWHGMWPDSLAPAWFVGPGGVNGIVAGSTSTGDGWRPRHPLPSPEYALVYNQGKMTFGSRVVMAAGTYRHNKVAIGWADNTNGDGGAGEWVQITGEGINRTTYIAGWVGSGAGYPWLNWYSQTFTQNHKLRLEECWNYAEIPAVAGMYGHDYNSGDDAITGADFVTYNVIVGHPTLHPGGTPSVAGAIIRPTPTVPHRFYNSLLIQPPGADPNSSHQIKMRIAGALCELFNSAVVGGAYAFWHGSIADYTFRAHHSALIEWGNHGIRTSAAGAVIDLKDTVILSTQSATYSIYDQTGASGLTWTAENMANCFYDTRADNSGAQANLYAFQIAGTGGNALVASLAAVGLAWDSATMTFSADSTARNGKIGPKTLYDLNGNPWTNPGNIGPVCRDVGRRKTTSRRATVR